MKPVEIIMLAINASMFLVVFVFGTTAKLQNITYLFRHPRLLVRAILSMNVIMLAFAVAVCLVFRPPTPIQIALVGLAVSPVPPFLPSRQFKAGGTTRYTFGLLVAAALVAIPLAPLAVEIVGRLMGLSVHMPIAKVAAIMAISILIPLLAGVAFRHFFPDFAERIRRPAALGANIVLALACIPVLVIETPVFWTLVGNGVLLCLVGFTVVGLAVGHFLGGPVPDNRTALALATGSRHPAISLAIASINFPDEKAVIAVVVYHLIIGALVATPYVIWRIRADKAGHAT
ncbi:MAG TPA: hypothetical protein VKB52_11165 [Rhodanobacteraceae bacterium]|nr:hypothetical protein [Rhodanobacteraceae bacterium]